MRTSAAEASLRARAREALAEMLCRRRWDGFGTHTWDIEKTARGALPGPIVADRNLTWWEFQTGLRVALRVGLARLDERGEVRGPYVNQFRKNRPNARMHLVRAMETHKNRSVHLHTMIVFPQMLAAWMSLTDCWEAWFNLYGRGKFESPRDPEHVAKYVSKYVLKDDDPDIRFSDHLDLPPGLQGA